MKKILVTLICAVFIVSVLFTGSCKKTVSPPPIGDTTYKHINDSLWAYYPLNGNLGDSSGNSHALTLFGGAALGADSLGNLTGALDFPGGPSYGLIADGINFNSVNFTVSLFAMYRQTPGFLLCKVDYNDATGSTFNVGVDPTRFIDTMRFAVGTGANICSVPTGNPGTNVINMPDPTQNIRMNAWYHIVIEVESGGEGNGTMKLYINGALVQSASIGVSALSECSNAPFILGNWWSGDNNPSLNGKIDEIRIYHRVLKDNEVSYLYHNFTTR